MLGEGNAENDSRVLGDGPVAAGGVLWKITQEIEL